MNFDSKTFRQTLGLFATGIAIVTTQEAPGQWVGVTVNSFNSVSLDPPLVLFSLDKRANSLEAFKQSGGFAVNLLKAEQQALSDLFASKRENKFEGIPVSLGKKGLPLLEGCLASFECRTVYQYEGGDHLIFVGEVEALTAFEGEPLLYYRGQYRTLPT